MASVFKRKDSPFWWIRQKDIAGKWGGKSTKYRVGSPVETKRARSEASELTSNELGRVAIADPEMWDRWAPGFFKTHCTSPATRKGYLQSWSWIMSYLADRGVVCPRMLAYKDAFDYIGWRCARGAQKSTALRDLKVLRLVMRHAVRLGLASGNPCDRMGVERPAPKVKAELTDEQIGIIYDRIKHEHPWMLVAFSICLYTGCRVSEANLDMIEFDFDRGVMTFINPKGGVKRAFTTLVPARLQTVIDGATKKHARDTLTPPKTASQLFGKFFRKIGLKGVTIHCTRVTYISRLARSGVPERIARLAVNHSSEVVHRTYQRLGIDDLRQLEGAILFPSPDGDTKKETPGIAPSRRASGSQAS